MIKPTVETPLSAEGGRDAWRAVMDSRRLPPRVRSLLEGSVQRTGIHFDVSVIRWLDGLESELFKRAEQAPSNERQSADFEALREIKRYREDLAADFASLARSDFFVTVEPKAARPTPARATSLGLDLALVDNEVLEEDLALEELVRKSEVRHSQSLYLLGHRIAVMFAVPAFDNETLPLGPSRVGAILARVLADLELQRDYRVLAYQLFDRIAMGDYGRFLDTLNEYLATQRVLPNLRFRGNHPYAAPIDTVNEAAASDAPASPSATETSGRAAVGAGMGAAGGMHPAHATDESQGAPELFPTLRQLLADKRRALGAEVRYSRTDYLPTALDLQSALGSMQALPLANAGIHSGAGPRSADQLRQDLLAQLRDRNPDGKTPVLAEEDEDTLDLVGMLFESIASDLRARGPSRTLLNRLQVPLLRVALRDKDFFARRDHPARRLLNTVAEAGERWIDDLDADKDLIDKMNWAINRLATEFDGDLGLFESTASDLDKHLELVAHRAAVAERRHVAAAKGREKLAAARERASTAIGGLIERHAGKLAPLMKTMLEQAWTDVLALAILRHGEESAPYQHRLDVADQLLRRGTAADAPVDPNLKREIESGLVQVGMHGDEARTIARRLLDPDAETDDAAPTPTAIALALKNKARLGSPVSGDAKKAKPIAEARDLNDQELAMLERIKRLPFGAWFEFVVNQQGDTVRRKLAWFSTMSGRCLFVNQRGVRVDDKQLSQLARDLVRGEVRFVPPHDESIIDRTWKTIMGTLRQFKHGAPVAVPQ
ncbi:MAG: DUF1631 family protein [Rhodanobacteraceae bacterium]